MNNSLVYSYIEDKYQVKLYSFQKKMIDAILSGYTFSSPRGSGRTMIVDGIKSYIDHMHSMHRRWDNADINIKVEDVAQELQLPVDKFYMK